MIAFVVKLGSFFSSLFFIIWFKNIDLSCPARNQEFPVLGRTFFFSLFSLFFIVPLRAGIYKTIHCFTIITIVNTYAD